MRPDEAPGCRARGHRHPSAAWRDLRADVRRYLVEALGASAVHAGPLKRVSAAFTPSVLAVALHRLAHWFWAAGWRAPARAVAGINRLVHKATITPASCIGPGFFLPHPVGVTLHGTAGDRLTMYSSSLCTSEGPPEWSPIAAGPRLGDRVVIGVFAGVHGPVTVGDDVRVAFRSDLLGDVPAGRIAASRHLRVGTSVPGAPDEA